LRRRIADIERAYDSLRGQQMADALSRAPDGRLPRTY
jgi:hypothetical protein